VLEGQARLLLSSLGVLRAARLRGEVEALRLEREQLVARVRAAADRLADPGEERLFQSAAADITPA
jgi:hypothetical protein